MQIRDEDFARVRRAIAAAEQHSSGEILCVVAPRCGDSLWVVSFWSLCAAVLAPLLWWILGVLGNQLVASLFSEGWLSSHASGTTSLWIMALLPLVAALLTALLLLIPTFRRWATPRRVRRARVHHAALQQFVALGVTRTQGQTGVLIFLALAERQAEVIADSAIYDKVAPQAWGSTIDKLLAGARAGDIAGGFVAAIEEAGALLQQHFPSTARNPDELPDHLILLP